MPAMQGIMLSSIPKSIRSTGSSVAQIFQNMLGYMPAPATYGLVLNLAGGHESRAGMIFLMGVGSLSTVGLYFSTKCRYEQHNQYLAKQHVEMADL